MTKKLSITLLCLFMAMAAGSLTAQDINANSGNPSPMVVITPSDFPDKAPQMIGQTVEIEGLVVHVCKHGGKKLFIVGENPDIRIKIDASDKVSVFDPELEGSTIKVKGTVAEIEVEMTEEEKNETRDAEHENYYHKPQYSISCLALKVLD